MVQPQCGLPGAGDLTESFSFFGFACFTPKAHIPIYPTISPFKDVIEIYGGEHKLCTTTVPEMKLNMQTAEHCIATCS